MEKKINFYLRHSAKILLYKFTAQIMKLPLLKLKYIAEGTAHLALIVYLNISHFKQYQK